MTVDEIVDLLYMKCMAAPTGGDQEIECKLYMRHAIQGALERGWAMSTAPRFDTETGQTLAIMAVEAAELRAECRQAKEVVGRLTEDCMARTDERDKLADALEHFVREACVNEASEVWVANVCVMAMDALHAARRTIQPECSVCRRRHGLSIRHPCE